MKKQEMLNILYDKVKSCDKCELHKTRTKTVFGEGKANSKLVFIGEAPGKDEDINGTPFCGRSGKLLTSILQACGLSRESVYICNILKCRPPNNRVPEEYEVAKCKKYLELQLNIIQPSHIICLGTTAAQRLLGCDDTISSLRGGYFERFESNWSAKIIPTFHPSYALRNPEAKHEIYKDIMKVLEELKCC
jgi:uracil-DNA glycosylase family 4